MHYKTTKANAIEVQKSWTSGPSVLVTFFTKKNQITKISLGKSQALVCQIIGPYLKNEILGWMESYSKKEKGKDLPLDFASFTPFRKQGLLMIKNIPFGAQTTYGEIASLIGQEKGARAIGNVCNKNPYPLVIPCHRVIQKSGNLGGFAYSLEMKQSLLDFESS